MANSHCNPENLYSIEYLRRQPHRAAVVKARGVERLARHLYNSGSIDWDRDGFGQHRLESLANEYALLVHGVGGGSKDSLEVCRAIAQDFAAAIVDVLTLDAEAHCDS